MFLFFHSKTDCSLVLISFTMFLMFVCFPLFSVYVTSRFLLFVSHTIRDTKSLEITGKMIRLVMQLIDICLFYFINHHSVKFCFSLIQQSFDQKRSQIEMLFSTIQLDRFNDDTVGRIRHDQSSRRIFRKSRSNFS